MRLPIGQRRRPTDRPTIQCTNAIKATRLAKLRERIERGRTNAHLFCAKRWFVASRLLFVSFSFSFSFLRVLVRTYAILLRKYKIRWFDLRLATTMMHAVSRNKVPFRAAKTCVHFICSHFFCVHKAEFATHCAASKLELQRHSEYIGLRQSESAILQKRLNESTSKTHV